MEPTIADSDMLSIFPSPDYQVIWRTAVRLVVYSRPAKLYLFYRANGQAWDAICQNEDFFRGREIAEDVWNPKEVSTAINTLDMLMEQVDSLVSSVVAKGQQAKLTKYDFSAVYFGSDHAWHAFYPSVAALVEFHNKLLAEQKNQAYLDYLTSQELLQLRRAWEVDGIVAIPEEKPKRQQQ